VWVMPLVGRARPHTSSSRQAAALHNTCSVAHSSVAHHMHQAAALHTIYAPGYIAGRDAACHMLLSAVRAANLHATHAPGYVELKRATLLAGLSPCVLLCLSPKMLWLLVLSARELGKGLIRESGLPRITPAAHACAVIMCTYEFACWCAWAPVLVRKRACGVACKDTCAFACVPPSAHKSAAASIAHALL